MAESHPPSSLPRGVAAPGAGTAAAAPHDSFGVSQRVTAKEHLVSTANSVMTCYRLHRESSHHQPHPEVQSPTVNIKEVFSAVQKVLGDQKLMAIPAGQGLDQTVIDVHATKEDQTPFYIMDLAVPVRLHSTWCRLLPRVKPHFAVKCNPDAGIIAALAACGCNFDCASPQEIDLVLGVGVKPDRIIYANPCKTPAYIRHARDKGVIRMTFDCENEIEKMMQNCPNAEFVLRLATDDGHSLLAFSMKFGASVPDAKRLVRLCKKHKANLVGCSFHVGSGCQDPTAYDSALARVKEVFEYAATQGFKLRIIDLGGGWPGSDIEVNIPLPENDHDTATSGPAKHSLVPPISVFADHVSKTLDKLFPRDSGVEIIAEPGRYFATEVTTLACSVICKKPIYNRTVTDSDMDMPADSIIGWKYYLSDGVYGSMNNALTDHVRPLANVLFSKNPNIADTSKWLPSTLFGPTCDSLDTINKNIRLPELFIDDWVYLRKFGAYTQCLVTRFNGFAPPTPYYVMTVSQKTFDEMKGK